MASEIVDFPMKNAGSFNSYVNVYKRVTLENLRPDLKRRQFSIPNTISGSVDATKTR